jgi:hypothetical protein
MARHILIDGVDRWADYVGDDLKIQGALTYIIDTASFKIRGAEPAWGSEVFIEDDEHGRLFGGVIVSVVQDPWDPVMGINVWSVDCDDFTALLNQKTVTEHYQDVNATEVFNDLAARYAPGFDTMLVVNTGRSVSVTPYVLQCPDNIEYLDLVDVPLGEAFTAVCDQVGWHWFPDYAKGLHFFGISDAEPAPFVLEPGGNFKNFHRDTDGQGVKNRILVRGGMGASDQARTAQWIAKTGETSWTMAWTPKTLGHVTVDGVEKVVGWDGIDGLEGDTTVYHFMVNPSSRTIQATSSISIFTNDDIRYTANPEIPIIATVDDTDSQEAMAAIFGGDGIIEDVLVDDTIVTLEQALLAGQVELRKFCCDGGIHHPRHGMACWPDRGRGPG